MDCNGKCYLTKQLAEEAAGEEKNPFGNNSYKTEIPHFIIAEKLPEFHFAYNPAAYSHRSSGIQAKFIYFPFHFRNSASPERVIIFNDGFRGKDFDPTRSLIY